MKWSRREFMVNGVGLASAIGIGGYTYFNVMPKSPTVHVQYAGLAAGHAVRDAMDGAVIELPMMLDTLIVGSGVAAISAAWQLKKGQRNFVILNGPETSGNSASGQYEGMTFPTGAHYLAEPSAESIHVKALLKDLGLLKDGQYDEMATVHAPAERLWRDHKWQPELLPTLDEEGRRFFEHIQVLKNSYGNDGKRAFVIPVALASNDEAFTMLDQITFATWLEMQNYRSESLLWYLNYCCLDDYGQGIEDVSAWAGLQYFAARTHSEDHNQLLTWDGGLGALVDKMRVWIDIATVPQLPTDLPDEYCYAMAGSAVAIEEQDDCVTVDYVQDGQRYRIKARNVICAAPLYMASRIVKNMAAYGFDAAKHLPIYAPWIIGNFVLKGFPKEHTSERLAWDNVVYQGPTLGYVNSTHQHIYVAMPEKTVFTSYRVLSEATPDVMRQWLINAPEDELIALAAEDLSELYGKEFSHRIEHIDLTVRGHAMASPRPGFLHNQGLLNLRAHDSRLLFAHSDLSGYSIFEEACWWGVVAAQKIMAHPS